MTQDGASPLPSAPPAGGATAAPVRPAPGPQPVADAALGQQVARGFTYGAVVGVLGKLVSAVGQVVVAWFVTPYEYGLLAAPNALAWYVSGLQQAGIGDILVQRHRAFRRWANPAFWMALTLAVLGAGILMTVAGVVWLGPPSLLQHLPGATARSATAPAGAATGARTRVAGLLLVFAGTALASGLMLVPQARLQMQMRFRVLIGANLLGSLATVGLSVALAWLGCGAFAIALPWLVVHLARAGVCWGLTRPPVRLDPQWRRWRFLAQDSSLLLVANLCNTAMLQNDNLILSLRYPSQPQIAGAYYYAFSLATQSVGLLMANLAGLLFPTLSHMQHDPPRLRRAASEAIELLLLLGVPACFLQAALAEPLIHLLLKPAYYPAIVPLQYLSLGMAFYIVDGPTDVILKAQARFRLTFWIALIGAIVFTATVLAAALWAPQARAAATVALVVGLFFAVRGPVVLYTALRPLGGRWRDLLRLGLVPVAAGAVAVGGATLLARRLPAAWPAHAREGAQVAVILVVSASVYLPLWRWGAPQAWAAARQRVRQLLGR